MAKMPTLILTPRYTEDSQALWRAAIQRGWQVQRLTTWRVSDDLRGVADPVLYVESMFGASIAEQFGLRLHGPGIEWLPQLPEPLRKREIKSSTLRAARQRPDPAFIKPPNDKSFPAKVYKGSELPVGYDEESPVLISEIVDWEKEFRCFVLNGEPATLSVYLRHGELQREADLAASESELTEARAFVRTVIADENVALPQATVLDVGVIEGRGWAVVEQNAAWGSGIYGCDPDRVLDVLQHASEPE